MPRKQVASAPIVFLGNSHQSHNMYSHTPVLLQEAIEFLNPQPGQNFIDSTLGGGGYTRALAEKIKPEGKVLAIDLDQEALASYQGPKNVILVHGNFADLDKIVRHHNFANIQGIVADIGLSSNQLDKAGRGLSFQRDEPLDMRFDPEQKPQSHKREPFNASYIVNHYEEQELKQLFDDYAEDKFDSRFARAIVARRQEQSIETTTELFEIIKKALPAQFRFKAGDSARRIFQALRIEVNHELENLKNFLPDAFAALPPGGRLAVISFHSLEDRIVKQYFHGLTLGCICPPEFPECRCYKTPQGKILTKKPVTASAEELKANSRSAAAKLRVIQKLT